MKQNVLFAYVFHARSHTCV